MLDPHHPLHRSIVRIRDETGEIVGAGFLAAPGLVCTCAHVICKALGLPPETTVSPPTSVVSLDFPYLGEAQTSANVEEWVPIRAKDGGGDIAVLRLTSEASPGARPARLLPVSNLSGREFAVFGFPYTFDMGQNAYGILHDRLANGWVELQGTTTQGYRVKKGYSGTPVWDSRGRGVVGMVVAEDSRAKVAFLIPNDLIQQVCPDIKLITLSQMFKPLTDGLMGLPGSPLSGVEQFLLEYLGTPERPAPFGGRHQQLTELDRWLATPAQPYALLVAEAGRGKSALLAQWVADVADERRAEVVFVPISIRFSTSLKSTTLGLLGARLRYLHSVKADLPRDAEAWLAEIDMYLREDRPIGSPLLIVLDGADEATAWMVGRDLRFPPEPGRGVKVLVSARPLAGCDTTGWVRRLEWQGVGVPMELPLLDRADIAKVLRSMGDPLTGLATQVDAVGELYRLSEGDPLLVRLYVQALCGTGESAAFLTAEELGQLKPGLAAYFDQWWEDQHRQWGLSVPLKEPAVRILLNLLACALGPLSTDDLLALMKPKIDSLWLLEEALRPLARFVVGDGKEQGYIFSHPRLNQYFYEKLPPRERQGWEQRFLSYGRQILGALDRGKRDPREVSSYVVRYYGAHLERGDAHPDRFYELVSEGWQRAWEALEGTYDGFLSDLTRAWKRTEASGAQAQSTEERGRAIGRQCRYALIVASINSLVEYFPPTLLAALVDKGVWTPVQGLAYARRIPDEWRRSRALATLAPQLPEPLRTTVLQEALVTAQAITYEVGRTGALTALAPQLPEPLLHEVLAAAPAFPNPHDWVRVQMALASQLSEPLRTTMLEEALAAARAVVPDWQARALTALAPHLPEPLRTTVLEEALVVARTIASESRRVEVLTALAPLLSESLRATVLEEALTAARAITTGYDARNNYLGADIPKLLQHDALIALAPQLPEPLRTTVLQEELASAQIASEGHDRTGRLTALAPHVPEPLRATVLHEALAAARAITDGHARAEALVALAPQVPEPLQVMMLHEALTAARAIADEYSQARALTALAPQLPEPLRSTALHEALAAARTIANRHDQAEALVALAPQLSEPVLHEALAAARAITDASSRAKALTGIAPQLPEPLRAMVLHDALTATQTIANESGRAGALVALAPQLPEPLLQEVLVIAQVIPNEITRAEALTALAPHMSEPLLEEALVAARAITHKSSRTKTLMALAPYVSEPLLHEALVATYAIYYADDWARALVALAPQLSEPVLHEALAIARTIPNKYRALVLAALAPQLSEPLRGTVLHEALVATQTITDQYEYSQAEALVALAPQLSEPVLHEALAIARTIPDGYDSARAKVLTALAPQLSEPLRGTVLHEALQVARTIYGEEEQTRALVALAPQLSEPLRGTVLHEALQVARTVTFAQSGYTRARALTDLALHMKQFPVVELYALWCETLRILATRSRSYLLSDIQALIPIIATLGGKEALVATAQAIFEIGKWFP